jgi:DNA processing protein
MAAPVASGPPHPAARPLALPNEAYVAAMLTLPSMWPARAAALLGIGRAPGAGRRSGGPPGRRGGASGAEAWALVCQGRAAEVGAVRALVRDEAPEVVAAQWAAAAARTDVAALWAAYARCGARVDLLGRLGYPARLAGAPGAPYVVFRRGRHIELTGPTAAIVGTRRATPGGREIASQFGAGLAAAGVRVVSGLALGIDAAAHEGALTALPGPVGALPTGAPPGGPGGGDRTGGSGRTGGGDGGTGPRAGVAAEASAGVAAGAPIGVVAGGLDRPYPARHRVLWDRVAAAGALVSQWPLGTASEGWRFPARNRLIVALADVVVVVESRETGGSMLTAELALEQGVPVLAVPGSIRSPASAGTNRLLGEGAVPACSVDDVLGALSLGTAGAARAAESRPAPTGDAATVLAALGWSPVSTDSLVSRTGLDPARLAVVLAHLELDGWAACARGWWQRVGTAGAG